jgi:chromosomal replication initiator protein
MAVVDTEGMGTLGSEPTLERIQDLWSRVLDHIRASIQPKQFDLWFRRIQVVDLDDREITLEVPNRFFRDWVRSFYLSSLRKALETESGRILDVQFLISTDPDLPETSTIPAPESPPRTPRHPPNRPRPTFDLSEMLQINPRFTFDTFVVGVRNQLAHAAALAIADRPSQTYNPLFVHGSVGLGKTHLLQAICHSALGRYPDIKIAYISCETFVNAFIGAIESGKLKDFRYRYRGVDMLLVDDIHFLAHKERTQEEFFHTFNALYNAGKQIVLSSDSPPQAIATLQERLASRFRCGLVTEIEPPIFETRISILKRYGERLGVEIPDDVCEFIASHVTTNIRVLEGALHKVLNFTRHKARAIDLEAAREALPHLVSDPRRAATLEDITRIVGSYYKVKVLDILGKRRTKVITLPRQICMFLARRLTSHSLQEIGGYYGGRDHSTVLHGIRKIEGAIEDDSKIRERVDHFLTLLR